MQGSTTQQDIRVPSCSHTRMRIAGFLTGSSVSAEANGDFSGLVLYGYTCAEGILHELHGFGILAVDQ